VRAADVDEQSRYKDSGLRVAKAGMQRTKANPGILGCAARKSRMTAFKK